jgi:hypothetical protein
VETVERQIAEQMMPLAVCFFCLILLGCGEWVSGTVGKASCEFGSFNDFYRPVKMASGNNGNELYILDNYDVNYYKRDNLYECAFDLEYSYPFRGSPSDVFSTGNGFYVQDGKQLKSMNDAEACYAKDGFFAIYGDELAIGSNTGIEIWSINPCIKKADISSQRVLALAATSSEYFAAEGISAEPRNLTMYSKNGSPAYSDPMSSTPGNEKNFCSADRVIANNHGVYLLDKKCGKIGVYDNRGVWRKTVSLESLGIKNALDIAPGEYSYIFILHGKSVEKVNML